MVKDLWGKSVIWISVLEPPPPHTHTLINHVNNETSLNIKFLSYNIYTTTCSVNIQTFRIKSLSLFAIGPLIDNWLRNNGF